MDQRIRVLRLIARMNVGGPALQVVGLHEALDPSRFDQRLLTGSVAEGEADYLELRAPSVDAIAVPGLGRSVRVLGDARAFAAVAGEIRRFRPHVVHTHTAKAGVLGRLAAFLRRVPVTVHTFHGHLLHGYFSPRVTRAVATAERALAARTTKLVAVGSQVRDDLLAARIGRPEQYIVVPPGVELPRAPNRATARANLGLAPDIPVLAFVARLTTIKRPDRFVEVAKRVLERRGDAVFVVAGEGEELAAMQAAAAGLGPAMRFLGWRPDIETIYAAADLAVLTSDNEGMPVSLIESSLVGCPAVTTDVGSAGEVVLDGATGFVTTPAVEDLTGAILRVLDDPALRARLSARAQEHAELNFGRQRLVDDVARLYEELVLERELSCARS